MGVATPHGGSVLGRFSALWQATIAILGGSLFSVWLGKAMVQTFSGVSLLATGNVNHVIPAAAAIVRT